MVRVRAGSRGRIMRRPGWSYPLAPWQRRSRARALVNEHPERVARVMVAVVQVLGQGPVQSQRKLRAAVREVVGRCSDGDVDGAVELLGPCVRRATGTERGATRYRLEMHALPPELRRIVRDT